MKPQKYCYRCSNSFVNGIDPEYDGYAGTIGKSDGSVNMMVSSAGLNKPAPVTLEVWKWSEEMKQNFRIAYFVPLYCPFCGRKIKENIPYLRKQEVKKNGKQTM